MPAGAGSIDLFVRGDAMQPRAVTDAWRTRVVVVDDSALVRSLLSEIINREPDMRCVGTAADPLIARELIRRRPRRDHARRRDAAWTASSSVA